MNWNDVLLLIVGAFSTFLFGEKLYTWIFVKEDRRSKAADNEAKAVETLQKALDLLQVQLEKSNQDSVEKQAIIVQQQKELYNERAESARKTTEIEVLKYKECRIRACGNREPQTGY